jgi:hypothetical protein
VYIKQGVYKITGSLDAAVAKGVEASGQEYSGSWEPHTEGMFFDVQHQVAPAEQSLKCADCHVPDGRMDFEALGYSADQVAALTALAATAPETAPEEVPPSGGVPVMPTWVMTTLAGMAALVTGVALRRRK